MAQGVVVGLDRESRTPTLPAYKDIIETIDTENSFVETSDINYINYVSEGFLTRYRYTTEPTKESYWKKFGMIAASVVILAAAVVATVFTCGAAGVALGAGLAVAIAEGGALLGAATAVAGISVGGAIAIGAGAGVVAGAIAVGAEAGYKKARQAINKEEAKAVKGRNEEIPEGYERKEKEESRRISRNLQERYIITDGSKNTAEAIIVPDYQVNQPYYN